MKSLRIIALAFAAVCLMSAAAYAADPTGTWKWTAQGRNGPQDYSATLALKDGQLTGAVTSPRGATDISDASYKDGAVAFSTVVTFNDNKFTIKYTGTLDGDSIKGSIERPGRDGGAPTKTDWAATRSK
jgi:hypothetical protein